MRNYGLEDPEPRFAWVTTAKNLIQYPSYRRDWVKIRRREFRMFMSTTRTHILRNLDSLHGWVVSVFLPTGS